MSRRTKRKPLPSHQVLLVGDDVGWWGWTEDPAPPEPVRMYLQRFTAGPFRIELEAAEGRRGLVSSDDLPDDLRASLSLHLSASRIEIEARWLEQIRAWGWVSFDDRRVRVYAGSAIEFERTVPVIGVDVAEMSSEDLAPLIWRW